MSNCTDHEPYMMYRGTDPSIMLCHNAESLFEGCFPVPGGHALVQIVNDCQVSVVKGMRFLHDADAPDRKSTRLNSSHKTESRMPSSA